MPQLPTLLTVQSLEVSYRGPKNGYARQQRHVVEVSDALPSHLKKRCAFWDITLRGQGHQL
jgi:hypothetical protein